MSDMLQLSSSAHIHSKNSTQKIILDVVIALLPATIAGFVLFGIRSALVVAVSIAAAVLSETLFNKIIKKRTGNRGFKCSSNRSFTRT